MSRTLPPPRIPLSRWREAGQLWRFRGHTVFTRIDGPAEAPALLLIHGFPTASWDWESLLPSLARNHRLLAVDMLGFGFSDKPVDYSYTIADQADLQEAFLAHHKIEAYGVLAHDYGDTVAQELLARQGEPGDRPRMRSLALLNGGLFPESYKPLLIQKILLSPLGPLAARLISRGAIARSFRRIFGRGTQPHDELIGGAWRLINHNDGLAVVPKVIRYMSERTVHAERWVGALRRATIPLKLIDGGADPISGRHMAELYRQLIPNPDITILDDIGHYPQCEAPDAVLKAFEAFDGVRA